MKPIQNSAVKERTRLRNENEANAQIMKIRNAEQQQQARIQSDAQQQEEHIQQKLSANLKPYQQLTDALAVVFIVVGVVGLFLFIPSAGFFSGLFLSAVTGGIVCGGLSYLSAYKTKEFQEAAHDALRQVDLDRTAKLESLMKSIQKRVVTVQLQADDKTSREIQAYEREVNIYAQKILKSPALIDPIIERTVQMFQRVISHADTASHIPFIQTYLTFTVNPSGISYQYPSQYSNPQSDFNFERERYHNLHTDSECEGLAQAVAKLSKVRMIKLYPPNSIQIQVEHMDAQVTMRFQGANKNYVPAKDIF